MKINVYRMYYHTVTKNEEGQETRRTSPETVIVAGQDIAEAGRALPIPPKGTENVILQAHILQAGVAFREVVEAPRGANVVQIPQKSGSLKVRGPSRLGY